MNFEYLPARHHAIVLNPFLQSLDASTPDPKTTHITFGGELGYHFHSGDAGASGLYIGPSLVAMRIWATASETTNGVRSSTSASFFVYGAALDVGFQHVAQRLHHRRRRGRDVPRRERHARRGDLVGPIARRLSAPPLHDRLFVLASLAPYCGSYVTLTSIDGESELVVRRPPRDLRACTSPSDERIGTSRFVYRYIRAISARSPQIPAPSRGHET